jgi:class 3 adenylate cyclase
MEPSEELRLVCARFIESVANGDEEAVRVRLSRESGFEKFGSDPDEWWRDGDAASLVWVQQMREIDGGFPWRLIGDVNAMVEGTVGWAGARVEFETSHGPAQLRLTYVFHLEHGEWKMVQAHHSVGSSNSAHGFMLTTSVDDIVRSLSAAPPDLSGTSAADGTVTIVFTDIEDSTRINSFLGDHRWLEVLRAHNDVIAGATASAGGTVVKTQGDGFMLAFSSARSAIRCAVEVQRQIAARFNDPGSPVRVRIGAHTGEAVREADDILGHAVSYAARVAASAAGGEIVASSLIHGLLGATGEFKFGEPREVELKGITGPQLVYPVTWVDGAERDHTVVTVR